jgi:histidinol-phosphatase (PHP family)
MLPMPQPAVYETHMHTPLCNHAEGEPVEYGQAAVQRGMRGITVTCHNPMPPSYGNTGRMTEEQVPIYLDMIERTRRDLAGQLEVRPGLECDFFPGYEDYVAKQVAALPLSYVIGSVHPFLAIWRRRFAGGTPLQTQGNYFDQIAAAAESKLFDCISHPDLIKNMTADDWDAGSPQLLEALRSCLDRVAATGVAMELNTSGLHKVVKEMNPNPAMLRLMRERNVPVVVGADAHVPQRVGANFEAAYAALEAAGYTHVRHFIDRKPHDLAIAEARASLLSGDAVEIATPS